MSQSLPTDGFKWKEPLDIDLNNYNKDSDKGLLLEVDLDYPEELHDSHKRSSREKNNK